MRVWLTHHPLCVDGPFQSPGRPQRPPHRGFVGGRSPPPLPFTITAISRSSIFKFEAPHACFSFSSSKSPNRIPEAGLEMLPRKIRRKCSFCLYSKGSKLGGPGTPPGI